MTREDRKLLKHFQEHERYWKPKTPKGVRYNPPRRRIDAHSLDWEEEDPEIRAVEKRPRRKPEPPSTPGLVIGVGPGACTVLCRGEQLTCRPFPGLAVGDRVLLDRRKIEQILPRSTTLSRPDPHNPRVERVIAANIDVVVIVVSVRAPELRPGLIDRYLVAIERSGTEPVVCVNKMDLAESESELAPLDPYHSLGIVVVPVSAATGEGIGELLEILAGRMAVLAGHSGVGKSSLLNAMCPELSLETRSVSEVHGKGRHTTTSSQLYEMSNGARIIDTPGIREFGLWQLGREELHGHFHEFDAWGGECRFADCTHTHEPGCAVKQAVEAGQIPRARYEAYCRILGSLLG
ncbi:MAG: ribosome small subunit-dependent GTPase A [Acidobacteria bacterium]|nr:ribosome small subunit-dependent GTPase A [Acidobacteriota bacterium]